MVVLNSKEQSLIEYMGRSDEHLRKGVSLIVDRGDPGRYFEAVQAAGLLDSGKNPMPVATEDGKYWQIPYWPMLDFLVACTKQAEQGDDGELANQVLQIIRSVSQSVENNGGEPNNYHTFRVFADILGLVPTTAVTMADVDLIPIWLGGRFDRGGVCNSLDKGAVKRFLDSHSAEDWRKALRIMEHCTATLWIDKEGFHGGVRREPESVVDDHWLKEMIKHHAAVLGQKLGQEAAEVFRDWVREVYREDERDLPSYIFRPAIEENEQNYDWNGVDNRSIEALRDALDGWIAANGGDVTEYVKGLLEDELEILRRTALYLINTHWDRLDEVLSRSMGVALFDQDMHHELYDLLDARFMSFSNPLKEATVNAIESIPLSATDDNPELLLARIRRRWLSAIVGKGSERADQLYATLMQNYDLGRLSKHPNFLSYSESRSGPGPSPYSPQELAELNRGGTLIATLEAFEPGDTWEGPTKRALVDSLEAAVGLDPASFIKALPSFLATERCYQYGVINGFKGLWDRADKDDMSSGSGWDSAWPALFDFFSSLISGDAFWDEEAPEDRDMTPTRDWIPGLIADFLRAGTRDDEKAYSPDLLPAALPIIDRLLNKGQAVDAPSDNAMTQAINSQKGKAVEALYGYALRSARVADNTDGNHDDAWAAVEPIYNRELELCHGGNFEFSTLLGSYLANLEYLNIAWVENHFRDIFSEVNPENFVCALGGLAYGQATRRSFALLRDNNVFNAAIGLDLPGNHTREKLVQRIALGYLWGDEPLDSTCFNLIFDNHIDGDLQTIATFFWSISNQDVADEQIERIMAFWTRCVEWAAAQTPAPEALLAKLSLLSCYLNEISDDNLQLMLACVPYVNNTNYSWELTKTLESLATESPANVVQVLDKYLENYRPNYDYQELLNSLIRKLAQGGQRLAALRFTEDLRQLRGMDELYRELIADDD
ncbi:hypothetical protein ACFL3A_04600 [Pseudomonadota bacterium]